MEIYRQGQKQTQYSEVKITMSLGKEMKGGLEGCGKSSSYTLVYVRHCHRPSKTIMMHWLQAYRAHPLHPLEYSDSLII